MSAAATTLEHEAPARPAQRASVIRRIAGAFWINWALMGTCRYAPRFATFGEAFVLRGVWRHSRFIRTNTLNTARRVLGPDASPEACETLAKAIIRNYTDTVLDFGQTRHWSGEQLRTRIESTEGRAQYDRVRAAGRGVILVTAHLGAFEVGIASLQPVESKINVVFKRDNVGAFEELRSERRAKLGVREVPVDDGLRVWFDLRDALGRDEVVLLQGDRVLPGQRGIVIPCLGGRIEFPTGPARLAITCDAPIVPVFAVASPRGTVRIVLEEPIVPGPEDSPEDLTVRIARVIERQIRANPEQWHVVHDPYTDKPATVGLET